jgi:acyl transferase domain-containing protein
MSDFNNNIAIIGMACHYPGAPNLAAFWQNLVNGVESISRFSKEELLSAGVNPELVADPNYVPAYGWLDGIDEFDAPFFGLTPREAELLDPQQRLFLMCAWHALEDAAVNPQIEKRPVGVFAGAGQAIYYQENILTNRKLVAEMGAFQTTLSNDKDFLATRTSYKLNLKGPSLSVQTACSTSLVAIHLANQSLLNGECDLALAGGSSIVTTSKSGYLYSNEGLFSPDGHCRAFDAQAGGMVGGDGVGAVVLKRLEDALAEGDTIYAVIKGTAVNNDGADKIGYTAPSIEGQAAVILEAQAVADVHPDTITMIEAHGTGTPLGDPIEVAALTAAFRTRTVATGYCALGTVKTNIGHTNAAAGVAGIIKTALSLHHKTIPPSLNFITSNPEINFEQSPFYVNTSPTAWTAEHSPRRAGVSSFGLGGTNAHAILEEAPLQSPSGPSRPYQLLTLSAKTETALARQTAGLSTFLQNNPNINLADVAHTLQIGRQRLGCQRAVVVQSPAEAVEKLKDASAASGWTTATDTTDLPLAFMLRQAANRRGTYADRGSRRRFGGRSHRHAGTLSSSAS